MKRHLLLAGAAAAILAFAAAGPAHAALVGYYAFENAGNVGVDSSGLGNNLLTFGTGVTWTASGQSGGGLSLTGSGGLTTVSGNAPSAFPVGNGNYSLFVDFKTNITGALGLIGWGDYGTVNAVNALRTSTTGLQHYWWTNNLNATATVSDNAWHTVLASYDGTTRRLFLDGSLVASDVPGAGVHAVTNANFTVGKTNTTNGEFFTGLLDDVAVFDTALTPAQAQAALPAVRRVPEPMTVTLLASGVALLGWQRRRRARAA